MLCASLAPIGAVTIEHMAIARRAGRLMNPSDQGGKFTDVSASPKMENPRVPTSPIIPPTQAAVPTASTIGRRQSVIVITTGVPPPIPNKTENPPMQDPKVALAKPAGNL